MKYIKQFESKLEPKVGDYVICTTTGSHMEPYMPDSMEDFFSNNIGKITRIEYVFYKNVLGDSGHTAIIRVTFKDVPENLKRNFYDWQNNKNSYSDGCFMWIHKNNIKHISKTKKDLEIMVNVEKYNL
jgi:hypothetical protein